MTDFQLGSSWGYNKDKRTAIKPEKAIRILAEVVGKNGVMILAAAPMAEGIIPQEQVAAMNGIGAWLKLYSKQSTARARLLSLGMGRLS